MLVSDFRDNALTELCSNSTAADTSAGSSRARAMPTLPMPWTAVVTVVTARQVTRTWPPVAGTAVPRGGKTWPRACAAPRCRCGDSECWWGCGCWFKLCTLQVGCAPGGRARCRADTGPRAMYPAAVLNGGPGQVACRRDRRDSAGSGEVARRCLECQWMVAAVAVALSWMAPPGMPTLAE